MRGTSESPDPVRLRRYSQNILTSGRSLLEIINDLLDLAKIEAGKLQLHRSEFSITELCREMIDFVRPLCDKRNQQIEDRIADDLPAFHSDSGRIKQILYNLLSNAIKFTPTGGSVALSAAREADDLVRLEVSDTGPGITPRTVRGDLREVPPTGLVDHTRARRNRGSDSPLRGSSSTCSAGASTFGVNRGRAPPSSFGCPTQVGTEATPPRVSLT